ncbi:MAG: aminodeoxychorismate synthase component I [Planctomycetales bacterium]|nr:aminodeoxychorismate synthase component I [Planctomycetales bacterium]
MKIELPLVRELSSGLKAVDVFRRLSQRPFCLFLDSALQRNARGRYSFVATDPFLHMAVEAGKPHPLSRIATKLAELKSDKMPGLPPFQGGAAGLFSYDLCRSIERVSPPRFDEFAVPAISVGYYDVVIAFDHFEDRAWIISQGFPETSSQRRRDRAARRLAEVEGWLEVKPTARPFTRENSLHAADLAQQYAVAGFDHITSDFSREGYLAAVQRVIDYIYAGDVFQVNLSQRLLCQATSDSVSLYLRLRERNPAPFAGYFDLGDHQIVSASPERFILARDRQVEARPIKGTRQRTASPEADLYAADDLRQSEKDRAENVMIVDLMRNDMSRVCRADSVQVTQLCELEVYEYVQHLVSEIRGELEAGKTAIDLIRAAFPGGSITGAPKVRAMEIISELEPTARGAYCGSLGYIGFDGSMDLSILIRTITACRGWWQLPVGGGIVAQSNPQQEYEETWHKATGMLKALR